MTDSGQDDAPFTAGESFLQAQEATLDSMAPANLC
jgi:hypothetical protein